MMNEGLSRMRDRMLGAHRQHTNSCLCSVCQPPGSNGSEECLAHQMVFKGTTALWESCVCPKEELDLWHDRKCLLGECLNCGVEIKLLLCPSELDMESTATIKWRRFEKTEVGMNNDTGLPRLILQEAYKETTPTEFVIYMKSTLQKFIKHNYVARWQDSQCRLAMSGLREGVLLSHIDFAENYTFQVRNEVQSEYYRSVQVTILVHITYRVVIDEDTTEPTVLKESHFYVSDDRRHDSFFVQHCLLVHWRWLQEKGFTPVEHIVWSDGCASQFKGCNGLYFVGRYPGLTKGCAMKWNFFGTVHGKGKHCQETHPFSSMLNYSAYVTNSLSILTE
jgi:hypothetical protein